MGNDRCPFLKSSFLILVGMNILGCAGTTTVERQHHLLMRSPSTASVCFLRPKEGFMGVRGKPIGIQLDGEHLLNLSIGEYTFLDLNPGEYDMVVTNWTLEGPDNAMAETSRDFSLKLEEADSAYLLFTLESIDFWEAFNQGLADRIDTLSQLIAAELDTVTIRIGKHTSLKFFSPEEPRHSSQSKPGVGYKVELVSRETAVDVATKLEPVEGAQNSPLHK